MKFDRKDLLKSLLLLKPAISSASSIAQLKHIWFDKNKACAYNGSLGIKIDLDTDFKFAVLGAPLLKLLSDDSVDTVSLEEANGVLTAKLGRATVELPTMDLSTAPWAFPANPEALAGLPIDAAFMKALRRASLVRAANPLRVEHYGVILYSGSEKELLVYTTDSRTMIEVSLKAEYQNTTLNKVVLPFEFVDVMQSAGEGSLSICKDCLVAEAEGILICSNLLDSSGVADLPALLDQIMQDKAVQKMIGLPDGLKEAFGRAEILADGGDLFLNFSVSNSQLLLEGKLPLGSFKETLTLEKSSIKASMGINGNLLKRVLGEGKRFALAGERLVVEGEDDFTFVQAAYAA